MQAKNTIASLLRNKSYKAGMHAKVTRNLTYQYNEQALDKRHYQFTGTLKAFKLIRQPHQLINLLLRNSPTAL